MSEELELEFNYVKHEKYNTSSIYIEDAIITLKKCDYNIIKIEKTKWDHQKAEIKLISKDLIEKVKSWETEINEYLKDEVGIGPITIIYGNKIYLKTTLTTATKKKENIFTIKSVWVNDQNKPFAQLWLEQN